jgi:hypothetical protein
MRLYLILIFFMLASLISCKKKTDILVGFVVGSEEKIWKENLRKRKQLEKKKKEGKDLSEILVFGEDTLVAQYEINEPLKTGRLRNLSLNLNGFGEIEDVTGYISGRPVTKASLLRLISALKDQYGSIDSTFSDRPNKIIIAEFADHNLMWLNNGTEVTLGYNKFEKKGIDSTTNWVYLRIKCANYEQVFLEDLASFKKSHRPKQILGLDFGETSINLIESNQVELIQLYNKFTHYNVGYHNDIKSIKFDVFYENKFKEEVLRIKGLEFNFPSGFGPSTQHVMYEFIRGKVGFRKILSKSETNNSEDLKPQISNLKILYYDGDVY